MFRRLSEPLALSEASLLALRPALNAPVLNVDFLPIGPARAAIVVFAEEYGGIGLAIGVRSDGNGQIVVFRNQEAIDASMKLAAVIDPALSMAEQMGFVFDEDMIGKAPSGEARSEAMSLWGGLMGEIETPVSLTNDSSQTLDSQPVIDLSDEAPTVPELLLDDEALLDGGEISLDFEDELPPTAMTEMPTSNRLSKFRSATPAAQKPIQQPIQPETQTAIRAAKQDSVDSGPDSSGVSALGRVPLVRVRRDGAKRVSYLARLLSSF
jgi:hypothetical protein